MPAPALNPFDWLTVEDILNARKRSFDDYIWGLVVKDKQVFVQSLKDDLTSNYHEVVNVVAALDVDDFFRFLFLKL